MEGIGAVPTCLGAGKVDWLVWQIAKGTRWRATMSTRARNMARKMLKKLDDLPWDKAKFVKNKRGGDSQSLFHVLVSIA